MSCLADDKAEFFANVEQEQNMLRDQVINQFVTCRKSKKMTQQDVADILEIKRPNITRFENGSYNPTLDMMVKVAATMGKKLEIKLVDAK